MVLQYRTFKHAGGDKDVQKENALKGLGGKKGDTFVTKVGTKRDPTRMEKVGNSLHGLWLGPLFILCACVLLWFNEEWAIKTHRSLHEALDAHVTLPNPNQPAAEHRGKLVHLTNMVSVEGQPVEDPVFGITRPNAVALERQVEILQWVQEIKKKNIKKSGYSDILEIVKYHKRWVKEPIDSSEFRHEGHDNCCGSLPVKSESFQAEQVKLGIYSMSDNLVKQLDHRKNVSSSEAQVLPRGAVASGNTIILPRGVGLGGVEASAPLLSKEDGIEERVSTGKDGQEKIIYFVKSTGDYYSTREKALAASNAEDDIGDVRITFSEIPCAKVSVLAQMSETGDELVPWQSNQGSGYKVNKLSYGVKSATDMIEDEKTSNTIKTWALRFAGWLLNFIGFGMITSIISTTADITLNWIPLLGPMSTSIINLGVTVANFIMANCTTMIVASIAWVVYRPLVGITLLAGSLGLFLSASRAGRGEPSPTMKPSKKTD